MSKLFAYSRELEIRNFSINLKPTTPPHRRAGYPPATPERSDGGRGNQPPKTFFRFLSVILLFDTLNVCQKTKEFSRATGRRGRFISGIMSGRSKIGFRFKTNMNNSY